MDEAWDQLVGEVAFTARPAGGFSLEAATPDACLAVEARTATVAQPPTDRRPPTPGAC